MTFQEFKTKYAPTLSAQQEAAVQAVEGYTLLLAVPGSGKTTVLVNRLGYMLLCKGIDPRSILTMTYTVAATADMKRRFASIFGEELAEGLEFRTINGVSARIIKHYERKLGRNAFELLNDEGQLSAMIGDIYRRVKNDFPTDGDIKAIRTKITYTKNMLLGEDEIEKLNKELPDFSKIYKEYQNTLNSRKLMDYDDQMVYAYRILRRYPDILADFQQRYTYFCVDEAQDSSKIQQKIMELLASKNGNLFMVGDEDQSIYGFRAACPQMLVDFEKEHKDAKVLLMETNYRSTSQIVSAADSFIQKNQDRHEKHMKAHRASGAEIREINVYDRRAQYNYLLKVAENCETETAILYRDNDSALPLIDMLSRRNIGYRCRQMDVNFFSNRVVRDIGDIIRFALNPTDGYLFLRIYYKLSARISKEHAEAAVKDCPENVPLMAYIAADYSVPPYVRSQCKSLHTHMCNMLHESGDKAVYRIVNYMGYGEYLQQREADSSRADILEALGAAEPNPARLLERLDELREIVQDGSTDKNSKFILSTIHSSKGLEYDRVMLMDVADGLLPGTEPGRTEEDRKAYEEERRLFYVGMTRAKNELSIFTFKKESLSSAFSDAVFGKEKAKAKPAPSHTIKAPQSAASIVWAAKDYIPGKKIVHRQYGEGTVISRTDSMIRVRFADGTEKNISVHVALKAGAISLK